MNALLTDLYQLTMAAGYFAAGKVEERATFELFVRRLPPGRHYLVAAGLAQAVDYLLNLRFTDEEIAYLKTLRQFARVDSSFFDYLRQLRFRGDLFAVAEGTPIYANEPILTIRAHLIEAQIVETFLLSTIAFQTLIATKASRVVEAAAGRGVVEFGTRRAHSPEAGVLAGRAGYIGGCLGTSNTLTGMRYGIPVFGTAAHSWIQAFSCEREAYSRLQEMLGDNTVYLIDTYDTAQGARIAASLGRPLWGVRLDSGNLIELSREVRRILDDAGLPEAKIMATSDLNEYKILELIAAGAPLDAFGVGTDLATSSDVPSLSAVYKLVELESNGVKRYTAKFSEDKATLPGAKQVFRLPDRDVVGCAHECVCCGDNSEALLRPVLLDGEQVVDLPSATHARERTILSLRQLPVALRSLFANENRWPVEYSEELLTLADNVRRKRMTTPPA